MHAPIQFPPPPSPPPHPCNMPAVSQLAMILQALAINSSLLTLDVGWNSLCEDQVRQVIYFVYATTR